MSTPLQPVTVRFFDQDGAPMHVRVAFQLTVPELYDGLVVAATTDAVLTDPLTGIGTINLFPNALGVNSSQYTVKAVDMVTKHTVLETLCTVPDSPCYLDLILNQAPYPSIDAAGVALAEAQGALALVTAQAEIATAKAVLTAADAASTASDVVLTHADVDSTNADVLLTHADAASTAADRAQTGVDANTATTQAATATTQAGIATAKAVLTAADAVSTNADAAATAADAIATAADRVQTGLDAATATTQAGNAATSASNAATAAATAAADAAATASAISDHIAAPDPHTQYQEVLESGTNIKTINGASLLGAGNLQVGVDANDINNIGVAGQQGFGVGIAPSLPSGMMRLYGTEDKASDNYGNYQYSDGSIMCYVPAFYYKYGTGANGLSVNVCDIKPYGYFADVATANADGYALHRAFYNAGAVQPGVFVDKYQCSNNAGVASSLKNGNPLSSSSAHNPFSELTGAPVNNYGGAIAAAKTRGASFFCASIFVHKLLALLALAHGQASTSTAFCAWFDAAGVTNFPKGNNNNALRDTNDTTVLYVSDNYSNCGKTGSANALAKTTHNGQACGVADLNGNMWEIAPGLTSNGSNYFLLKPGTNITTATGGNTLATDLWGVPGLAALYDDVGATYEALTASNTGKYFGAATQVLSPATSGTAWAMTGAGIPLATGVGGSNTFGVDYFYDARPNELCVISGGGWNSSGGAGVWALYLGYSRGSLAAIAGFRAALYL